MKRKIGLALLVVILMTIIFTHHVCDNSFYDPEATVNQGGFRYYDKQDVIEFNGGNLPIVYINSKTKKTKATIIYTHGNSGTVYDHIRYTAFLSHEGFNVRMFGYPGYGEGTGKLSKEAIHESLGYLAEWVEKNTEGPLVFFGQSLGGGNIYDLYNQMTDKGKVVCIVTEGAFSGYQSMGNQRLGGTVLTWPISRWLVSSDYNAENYVREVTIPKLFVHSLQDKWVPFSEGVKLFKAASFPREKLWIDQGEHIDHLQKDKYKDIFLNFIDRSLQSWNKEKQDDTNVGD